MPFLTLLGIDVTVMISLCKKSLKTIALISSQSTLNAIPASVPSECADIPNLSLSTKSNKSMYCKKESINQVESPG